MIKIYGIKACDTMQKARAWLEGRGLSYEFHDYKTLGVDRTLLQSWVAVVGWEMLLNRAGTTFRKLPDADKVDITSEKAIELMVAQPSMIKRPVLADGAQLLVGFKPERYEAALGQTRQAQTAGAEYPPG